MTMKRLVALVFVFGIFWALANAQQDGTCVNGANTARNCKYYFSQPSEFWAYSTDHTYVPPSSPGKLVIGPGSKLLFDFRPSFASPGFWFADMTLYPSHDNLLAALGLSSAYSNNPSQFFRSDFQSYIMADGTPLFGMTLNPGAVVSASMMINLCNRASQHMPVKNISKIAWVSVDPINQIITPDVVTACRAVGLDAITLDDLVSKSAGTDQYSALEPGEAYGYLREFPADLTTLAPKDIAVFNALPLNLGVVSGVITSVFQTVTSHVNLKSKERQTPNMVLLNYNKYPCISNFTNKPVHLAVASYGFSVEPSTPNEVDVQYTLRAEQKKWLALYHDNFSKILSYEDMCAPEDPLACINWKKNFGTKASNLGFLRNKNVLGKATDVGSLSAQFGYDLTPQGFGIPFQFFVDFVNYPPNANIKALIYQLSDMEMATEVTSDVRQNMSVALRQAFWAGVVPPYIITEINDAVAKYLTPYGVNEVKFRSSSNAEDLPGFDGAGLYDSFSADVGNKAAKVNTSIPCHYDPAIDDMVPPSAECALKGVYGSLWNQRAIEERTYARYKHNSCTMGIAVLPKYKELGSVTANAVGVTRRLDGVSEVPGYTFSIQAGDNDVTNPDPGTIAENTLALISADKTWTWDTTLYATPVAGSPQLNTTVLNITLMNQMLRVVMQAEYAYCIYKFNLTKEKCANISLNNVKTALDMEFKFIDGWRVHCKQLREFAGANDDDIVLTANTTAPGFCGFVNPAYFIPPDRGNYVNVALNKRVASASVVPISAVVNLQQGTVYGYPNKSNDGNVVVADLSVAITNGWIEYQFDVSYSIKYIRIFWCTQTQTWATRYAFTIRLTYANGTTASISQPRPTTAIQVVPITQNATVKTVRITSSGSTICTSEVQIWAAPYQTGDPNDFIPEPRTETQDCVWTPWTGWSACSAPCEGGTQTRTRGGQWCVNYVLNTTKETQDCNTQPCPVDCHWNPWSDWTPCVPCGWQQHTRTYVPAIGTGALCTGPDEEFYECILRPGFVCVKSRTVEFLINTTNVSNTTVLALTLENLFAASMNISVDVFNVYIVDDPSAAIGQKRVIVSFNSPDASGTPLNYSTQIANAQTLSNQLATNPTLTSYFAQNGLQPTNAATPDEFSYGIGYGTPSSSSLDSSTPVWAWVIIVVGALVLILVIAVAVIVIRRMSYGMSIEQMERYRKL